MDNKKPFRTRYNNRPGRVFMKRTEIKDPKTGKVSYLPSMTKGSFKEQCDVNQIIAKFKRTGVADHVKRLQGSYGDFSAVHDFRTALDAVMAAEDAFMGLPAKVRGRFANDPALFVEFATNPKNADELVEMGLAVRAPDAPSGGDGGTPPSPAPQKTGKGKAKQPSKDAPSPDDVSDV